MDDIFGFIWDAQQSARLRLLEAENLSTKYKAGDLQITLRSLERDHERLKLLTLAMWELLKVRTGVSNEDLRKIVEELDIADGQRDGKAARASGAFHYCHECSHKVPTSALCCPYCGTHQPREQLT